LTQLLFSYTSNTVLSTVTVPMWIDVIGTALLPHVVPLGQGKIAYSFTTDTGFPPRLPWNTAALFGYYWYAQSDPSGAVVNGFMAMAEPAAYTSLLGETSYQLLCRFVANSVEYPGWVQVLPGKAWTLYDCSAFAASWVQLGSGASTISAVLNEVMLETALTAPNLAMFADWYVSTPRRYFRHTRSSGGDANYLGFLLSIETQRRRIKTKVIPKFKQVDFYEYMDVIGWWLAGVLQQAVQNTNVEPGTIPICPLTWQQLAVVMRQAIGACWMPHILSGQFMSSESSTGQVAFYPFTWGTNCYPGSIASSIKLPRPLVESIRSLQGYMQDLEFLDQRTKQKVKGGMAYTSPVLGTYADDDPVTQYFFTVEGVASPVFTTDVSEIMISLTDFTYTSGVSTPLDANGSEMLTLVQTWNSWLTQNVDSNMSGLEAIGSDFPPKQLHSLHLTNFVSIYQEITPKERKVIGYSKVAPSKISREKKYKRSMSLEKGKEVQTLTEINANGDNWGVINVISQSCLIKSVYDNWQNMIVLPTVRTILSGSDFLTPYDFASLGAAYNEPYSLITAQAADEVSMPFENLTNRHKRFASTMYRSALAPPTTVDVFLENCIKTGRGGSLGSLFGSLAGSLLEKYVPGATQIGGMLGNAVGDMVPI